eukprot:symbB.v1.2.011298.t1/scaffold735.1/size167969/6
MESVSPAHGLHFQTEHENATENDIHGPRLLDAYATFPQNGALQSAREFHFFFNEVALRGPGALAVVRHSPTAVTVVDHAPTFRSVLGVAESGEPVWLALFLDCCFNKDSIQFVMSS